ncbi:hypothetical protein SDC9_195733 [bioreactor metagenome]|uniref:Uncharacterized protein n=1 Tax=bioreactor metagenome TaxID=1076179 RepID=A0A645IA53_9ZZZZ
MGVDVVTETKNVSAIAIVILKSSLDINVSFDTRYDFYFFSSFAINNFWEDSNFVLVYE